MAPLVIEDLPESIRGTKKALRAALPNYAGVFRELETEMGRRVDQIVAEREAGQAVVPIVQYSAIAAGTVPAELKAKIQDRGACVIRKTFDPSQAEAWDRQIATYVEENGLHIWAIRLLRFWQVRHHRILPRMISRWTLRAAGRRQTLLR